MLKSKLSPQTIREINAYFAGVPVQSILDELQSIPVLVITDQSDIDFQFFQNPIHNLNLVCDLLKDCRIDK